MARWYAKPKRVVHQRQMYYQGYLGRTYRWRGHEDLDVAIYYKFIKTRRHTTTDIRIRLNERLHWNVGRVA